MMNKFLFCIAVLLLFSCEKEIEYEGEGKAPVLVLDGILENDAPPFVRITRSVFFLSNSTISDASISDAVVKLTNLDSGAEYILSAAGNGYYSGNDPVLPNTRYRIEVSRQDYETISSEIQTVSDIVLSSIDSSSVESDFSTKYFVDYEFNDSQEDNFYATKLSFKVETTYFDANMNAVSVDTSSWRPAALFSTDPSFDFINSGAVFFKDIPFNGQNKVFSTEFANYINYNPGAGETTEKIIGYSGSLLNMSEDTYKYYKSIGNNQPFGPFSDPVNVHTNIENGLGIFGSVSSSTVEL